MSVLTVALAIIAIVMFIYTGASATFYAAVAVAIVVGMINAWLISKTSVEEPPKAAPATRPALWSRRAAKRKRAVKR